MGLQKNEESNKVLLTIAKGFLCHKIQADAPEQVGESQRDIVRDDGTVEVRREMKYPKLDGTLTGGSFEKKDWGVMFQFTMSDEGIDYIISIPEGGRAFGEITKRIPNLDITKRTLIGVGTDKEKNGRTFVYMKQQEAEGEEWTNVPFAYTKDNNNGIPQAKKLKNDKWDFTDQNEFLYDVAEEYFAKFEGVTVEDVAEAFDGVVNAD